MGVACAGHGRSVAVDVDPNVRKEVFIFFYFNREVIPDAPSPQKPHIQTKVALLGRQRA